MVESVTKNAQKYPDLQIVNGILYKHIPRRTPVGSRPEWKQCVPVEN